MSKFGIKAVEFDLLHIYVTLNESIGDLRCQLDTLLPDHVLHIFSGLIITIFVLNEQTWLTHTGHIVFLISCHIQGKIIFILYFNILQPLSRHLAISKVNLYLYLNILQSLSWHFLSEFIFIFYYTSIFVKTLPDWEQVTNSGMTEILILTGTQQPLSGKRLENLKRLWRKTLKKQCYIPCRSLIL